jgi:hypothetical protein
VARRRSTDGGSLLLNYLIFTDPQPLQIGTPATPSSGTINICVSEGATTAYCSQIVIAVQVGNDAGSLFAQTPAAGVNTGKWTSSAVKMVPGKALGSTGGTWAQFIFTCQQSTDYDISYPLVFSFAGQVNTVAGDCSIAVAEASVTSGTPPGTPDNQGTFTVTLAQPQFYLVNFVTTATGSPTVPCTQFNNGDTINLFWESNGAWFEVYKKGDSTPFYSGAQSTCSLPGIATDTTFFLIASSAAPAAGFTPVQRYAGLTVTVTNPDLTPKTVRSSGNVSVGSALTVTGTATVTGNLAVGGPGGAAPNSTLTVSGATTLMSNLVVGVAGASSATTTLNGNLTIGVPGQFAATLFVTGATTINNSLTVTSLTTLANVNASQATLGTLLIGQWTFAQDANSNLNMYNSGGTAVTLTLNNSGLVSVNANRVLCDQDPVNLYQITRNAYLNATSLDPGFGATNEAAKAYWWSGYPPDNDSNLRINYGNPF